MEHEEVNEPQLSSRNSRNVDNKILSLFWKVVENDQSTRLTAVTGIISSLITQESKFKDKPSPDLTYALERCIKGLPSTRKCARHGFTVLLTEIVKRFPIIKLEHILKLLEDHLTFDKSKGDKGSTAIAQSLAIGAVIRSQRIRGEVTLANRVIQDLLTLSEQRPFIRLANCLILEDLLDQLADVPFATILPAFEDQLKQGFSSGSPETLWLAVVCQEKYKKQTFAFMEKYWKDKHIFNPDKSGMELIGPLLKKTTIVHPEIHPLCLSLIGHCVKQKNVGSLWTNVIQEVLLDSSFQGTYLVFQLLQVVVPKLSSVQDVKSVVSAKLVESVIKILKGKSHPLRFSAENMLEWFVNFLKEATDYEIQFQIIKSFITLPGSVLFDSLTKTQFLQCSMPMLSPESCIKFAKLLINIISNTSDLNQNLQNSYSCVAAKQLSQLIVYIKSEEWKLNVLLFLFLCGFFKDFKPNSIFPVGKQESFGLGPSVKEACKQNFLRGVELLMRPHGREGYKLRLMHACESLIPLAEKINEILATPEEFSPAFNLKKLKDSWNRIFKLIKKFMKRDKKDQKEEESHMFQVLLINFGLVLFYTEAPGQDLSVLEELQECSNRALKQRKKLDKTDDGPPWIEVLTDVFLSVLSEGSHFLRKSIDCTFPLFCPFLTHQALQQILDIFKFEKSEDILVSQEDHLSGEEEEEELEFESPSVSDSDDEDEGDKMGAVDELRAKLQQALGPAAEDSHAEEEYLSDSDMFKLDKAISDAFRNHVKKPKQGHVKEQSLLNFRLRCLELLAKLIKLGPPLQRVFQCVEPLLTIFEHGMRSKNQRALSDKASSLLEMLLSFSKTFKLQDVESESISREEMEQILIKVMAKIRKTTDAEQSKFLSKICIFLIRCFNKVSCAKSKHEDWYTSLFQDLLKDYLIHSTSHINPQIFHNVLQTFPEFGSVFLPILVELSLNKEVRLFKKTQAFMLLTSSAKATANSSSLDSKAWCSISAALVPKVTQALDKQMSKDFKMSHTYQMLTALETVLHSAAKQRHKENMEAQPLPELKDVLKQIFATKFGKKNRKTISSLLRLTNCPMNDEKDMTPEQKLQQKIEKKNLKRKKKQVNRDKLKIQKTEKVIANGETNTIRTNGKTENNSTVFYL